MRGLLEEPALVETVKMELVSDGHAEGAEVSAESQSTQGKSPVPRVESSEHIKMTHPTYHCHSSSAPPVPSPGPCP